MPRYIYSAKSQPHSTSRGIIEAKSEADAINRLAKMNLFPLSLEPEYASQPTYAFLRRQRITAKDFALFTRELSTLIDAGVTIMNALTTINDQTHNAQLRIVLKDIIERIEDGQTLSESLSSHRQIFSPLYCAIIQTGEATGNLNDVLKRLADFMDKEEELKSSLRASLTYPFFILGVGVVTVIILLTFVIPRLAAMFDDMGQILPLPTQILINSSHMLRSYWWLIASILAVLFFTINRVRKNDRGRLLWDQAKLKTTIFGEIILKSEISRLTYTLSLLLSSGIPVTTSLEITASVINNLVIKNALDACKEKITEGNSLFTAIKDSRVFPEFVASIIGIGEESGSLDKSLLRIAQTYEMDVERTIKTLTRLLEPIIILSLGVVVGFIVLAMLLPIFQINIIVK
jgi:type II secretory pathway component PulF